MEFIIYLMISQFHFYLSLFHALYFINILTYHLLHCTWLGHIRSCMKDLNYRLLVNRWFVHNLFMDLGNPLEVVVYYLLIRGMIGLGHRDGFPMISALMCMVTHWTWLTVSHDIRLSSSHDFTQLFHCITSQL